MTKKIKTMMTAVEDGSLSDYRPQTRNLNKHTQRGMGALEVAMRKHGYVAPITVAADGEALDGSARLETVANVFDDGVLVFHHSGDKPIIMVRDDIPNATTNEARAISAEANRIAELNLVYDAEALLEDLNAGVDFSSIFNQDELSAMLAGLVQPDPIVDPGGEITETEAERLAKEYGIQVGQTWMLGRHKIACIDCLIEADVKRVVSDSAIKLIWADPPYGIDIVATNVTVGGGEAYDIPFGGVKIRKGLGSSNGAKPFANGQVRGSIGSANPPGSKNNLKIAPKIQTGKYAPVVGDETTETAVNSSGLYLSLFPDALHFWWGANYYANALPPSSCWIVWDKENTGNFADAELAWCSAKTAVRIFKHMWNGLMKDSEKGQRRVHPTQKPIELARWVFEKYGKTGDVILDPFLGSGISVLAAEQLNDDRSVIGFELAPEYIAATIYRWEKMTGQKAACLP